MAQNRLVDSKNGHPERLKGAINRRLTRALLRQVRRGVRALNFQHLIRITSIATSRMLLVVRRGNTGASSFQDEAI
jgi:hypothetical protein